MNHRIGWSRAVPVVLLVAAVAAAQQTGAGHRACMILADKRLEQPLRAIAAEFQRRTGRRLDVRFVTAAQLHQLLARKETASDVVLCMASSGEDASVLAPLPGATKVAWKYPSGEPVWAAATGSHSDAALFVRFAGGPTGHRLWSESPAGFTIVGDRSHAEAIEWVSEHRLRHTYPLTAARMLVECGGIRKGICIDIGCGTGALDVELAKRSELTIIGVDIDAEMKPLFAKRVRDAGLQDRVRFVVGDAQQLPFQDDFADVIVSRGTLIFIPDIARCLQEVDRVLKPSGVAFLGGRYVYTPWPDRISADKLRKIVARSGVAGVQVIDRRGQWVKIIGPDAPPSARRPVLGQDMLVSRLVADYGITKGKCLLICLSDSRGIQSLQQQFVEATKLQLVAMYPTESIVQTAGQRLEKAHLSGRITCLAGKLDQGLPFPSASFDLVLGVGPVLIWGDRRRKMREVYRVLRSGGVALIGGQYRGMPDFRKVSSAQLRRSAAQTGIASIQVIEDRGQWVEVRKGIDTRRLDD